MSVPVSVVARKNPGKKDGPYKYYALAQAAGEMNFRNLCKDASDGCTVMRADIAGVLYALIDSMVNGLSEGEIVRLGEFGSFQVAVCSTGVEDKEKFNVSQVKYARIVFRPGVDLENMLKTLNFKKVATRAASQDATTPKDDGGGGKPVDPTKPKDPTA